MRPIDTELERMLVDYAGFAARAHPRRGFKYSSLHEALLEEGTPFPYEPYTKEEKRILLDVFGERDRAWQVKQCFYNAQSLALVNRRLGYAEGFLFRIGLPIFFEHAWNFIPESGKPVDVTLRKSGEKPTCDPEDLLERASINLENAYFGVPVPKDEIQKMWTRTGRSEAIIYFPEMQMKIMRRGFSAWRGRE